MSKELQPPAIVNGIIYVCSVDANVYAVQAIHRSLGRQYQATGFMGAKPVIINGVLYAGGSSGLYALRANDGTFLWKFAGSVTAPAVGP